MISRKIEKIDSNVDEIILLYHQFGHLHYGEGISQLQHMLQSVELAIKKNCDADIIVAAFLHDIGHLLSEKLKGLKNTQFGSIKHEYHGGAYLTKLGFSSNVVELVESHVLAKRYLVATDSSYYETLSVASKKTLEYQGGQMAPNEISKFRANPLYNDFIMLRKIDDNAKEKADSSLKLEAMKGLLVSHLKLNLM